MNITCANYTYIHNIYMGGCQNYGPFLGTLNIRGRIIIGNQKRDPNFDNHPYIYIYTRRFLYPYKA